MAGFSVNRLLFALLAIACLSNSINARPARVPVADFRQPGSKSSERVKEFLIDETAVTNEEFAAFVRANKDWNKSNVKRIFAEEGYMRQWADADSGNGIPQNSPATNVSWFAARAFCRWKQGRLPTLLEWERVAAEPDEFGQPVASRILSWYEKPNPTDLPSVRTVYRNRLGVYDMHGLIWEWVEDFSSIPVSSDSRRGGSIDKDLFCAGGATSGINPTDYAAYMRYAFRSSLQGRYTVSNLGFRCAYDLKSN